MTGKETDPEWNNEDLVSLGDLRPSRQHFGPLPADPRNAGRQPKGRGAQRPNGSDAQRPNGSGAQQPPAGRQQPRRQSPPAAATNAQQTSSSTQRRQGRPPARQHPEAVEHDPRSSRRESAERRPRPRDDRFADRLAAADRASIVVKPTSGWRGAILKASNGTINLGLSADERADAECRMQARRPITDGTVAVFSRKGGVGKTTISAYLGLTLAKERGGRIVALDGDAEAGSLGWLLAPRAPSTLAALASADPIPTDYAGLMRYTATTPEGLEVIVGDPAEMGPISTTGLEAVADQLARHYDVSIFDTGAGVTRATGRVLVNRARLLLLVMGPSVDSVRAAERTLAWLDERPGEAADPEAKVIAVINGIPMNTKRSHIEQIEGHFADRCSGVVRIPWDPHLASGGTAVSLDNLAKPTRRAFLELAATSVGALTRPARRPAMAGAR